MSTPLFHRLAGQGELELVKSSGFLRGKAKRECAGGGDPCVKAFIGRLPPGKTGYSFTTMVHPSSTRAFFGMDGAEWYAISPGVEDVPTQPKWVQIRVEVVDE